MVLSKFQKVHVYRVRRSLLIRIALPRDTVATTVQSDRIFLPWGHTQLRPASEISNIVELSFDRPHVNISVLFMHFSIFLATRAV